MSEPRARSHGALRVFLGLAVGAAGGLVAHLVSHGGPRLAWFVDHVSDPVGKVFLRLLLMLSMPLMLSALAVGVAGMETRSLGRIGTRTIAWTVALSAIAVASGFALVHLVHPGDLVGAGLRERLGHAPAPGAEPSATDLWIALVPDNPIRAMAEGQVVAVLVFALFLGIGLSLTRTAAARRLEEALQGLFDVSSRLVQLVVVVAPLGVAALVFTTTARLGPSVLRGLAAYVLVVVAGLALHLFGVYSIVLRVAGRTRPSHFFRAVRMPMATAFSTASSNATLPTAIQAADEALDLPKPVSRFVLTLGATMNQNGTALFQAVTVLFLAELYGVHLSVGKELVVAGICLLAGIGTAGIPAGMVPILVTILAAVGIPAEGVGLVLGVDRLLDMCRTTVNVTGDLVEAVVVSRAMPESS